MPRNGRYKPKDSTNTLETKRYLCEQIEKQMRRQQWTIQFTALRTGVPRTTMSYINSRRVEKLSFNQLFRILAVLAPHYQLVIDPQGFART